MTALVPISIPGTTAQILAVAGDRQMVPIKPVCDALGIDVDSQRKKLDGADWASTVLITVVAADGKQREMVAIDADHLPMWLATIQVGRVSPDARPTLIAFQREAAKALRDYFYDGGAINPRATTDQLDLIQRRVSIVQALRGVVADDYLDAKGRILLGQAMGERPELDEAKRPLYVQTYLTNRGVGRTEVKAIGSQFGKLLRAAYFVEHGDQPPKAPQELAGGRIVDVYAYTESDRHLFDRVWIGHYSDRLTVIRGGAS